MLEELDELKKRWAALAPLPADVEQRVDQSLEPTFIGASNLVEDKNALGLEETEVFLERQLTSAGRKVEDFIAIERHRDALREARAKARAGAPLTLDLIRGLHHELTRGLKEKDFAPGEWRTRSRSSTTRRGRSVKPVNPDQVQELVRDLIAGYEGLAARVLPLEAIAWFAYHFQLIQPFNESNGRVQRLVVTFLLLKCGYRELVIEPRERQAYLSALAACDATVPADKHAPLFAGIATGRLAEFLAECLARTLEEVLGRLENRRSRDLADVGRASRSEQRALLIRLRRDAPDIAWRHDAVGEVRRLTDRLDAALARANDEGPLYSIDVDAAKIMKDHSVEELIRPALPAGGAGILGTVSLTLRPNPTAPVAIPPPRRFIAVVAASRIGIQLVTRWSHESRATVRTGPLSEEAWSQASLERHLAERVDSARRDFDAQIVELNRSKDLKGALKGVTARRTGLAARLAAETEAADAKALKVKAAEPTRPSKRSGRQAKEDAVERPSSARRASVSPDEKTDRAEREKLEKSEREKPERKSERSNLSGIRPSEPPLSL